MRSLHTSPGPGSGGDACFLFFFRLSPFPPLLPHPLLPPSTTTLPFCRAQIPEPTPCAQGVIKVMNTALAVMPQMPGVFFQGIGVTLTFAGGSWLTPVAILGLGRRALGGAK